MMKALSFGVSIAVIAAVSVPATANAQTRGVAPRPAPAVPQQFKFPDVRAHTLANGLRVYVVEDHSAQVVAVRAVFGVDSTFDPPGKEGLYLVTFGSLREGTTTRTTAELADASARIGTAVAPTAFTTVPAALESALSLMGDMLMHPSFEQTAIDRRKAAVQATFRSVNGRPATSARALMYALLDGRDDPVARSQYATEAGVASITRDDVLRFYAEHVGPPTMSLVIVGDVTDASAVATATKIFGAWTKTASATRPAANPPAPRPTTIYLRDIPGAPTYLYAGNLGARRDAPDAFAADILQSITSNRFFAALREKRAFMYSGAVSLFWKPAPRPGEFFGSTTVAAPKADSALVEWVGVLRGLRGSAPVSDLELKNAISARTGPLWTKTDGPDSVATRMAESLRDNLPPDFLGRYAAGIARLTPADIAAAASKYIDVDHLVIVVTGDRKVLEPALRAANIAPIVVVDANGKPITEQ
jgi:zinc protease